MKVCTRCNKKFLFKSPDPALCRRCYDTEARERAEAEARAFEEAKKTVEELAEEYQDIKSMDMNVYPRRMEQNAKICERFAERFRSLLESPYAAVVMQAVNDHFLPGKAYVKGFGYLPYEEVGNGEARVMFDEVLRIAEEKAHDYRSALKEVNQTDKVPCSFGFQEDCVVLDVETTGLSHFDNRITEIAAVKFLGGVETDQFVTLVNPGREISEEIKLLTGITNTELKRAPAIDRVLPELIEFLKDLPIVTHNASFDMSFLSDAYEDMGQVLKNASIDTLKLARDSFPGLGSYKLKYLKEIFGLNSRPSHRALADVYTTAELFALCRECPPNILSVAQEIDAARNNKPDYTKNLPITYIMPTRDRDHIDHDGPFYGKKIVFAGTFSMDKYAIAQIAVNFGAIIRTSVSGKTDFLVMGSGYNAAEAKARELNKAGKAEIQIISEADFFDLLRGKPCRNPTPPRNLVATEY